MKVRVFRAQFNMQTSQSGECTAAPVRCIRSTGILPTYEERARCPMALS